MVETLGVETALSQQDIDDLFHPLLVSSRLALAVSGGADSMALMVMAADWQKRRRASGLSVPDITVLTVDHGLRAESGAETDWVARCARSHELPHHVLAWRGEKPDTRLQETARTKRYRLMAEYCLTHDIPCLITAHHLQDQAETLLMRLARGSGIDGLTGMAAGTHNWGVQVWRPLLSVRKERLVAFLQARNTEWLEDPSNDDTRFERVRWRTAMPDIAAHGLTPEGLMRSAIRLARAREALERTTDRFMSEAVMVHPVGYCTFEGKALRDAPADIALRALGRMIRAVGGGDGPPNLAQREELLGKLNIDSPSCTNPGRMSYFAAKQK